MEISEVNDIGRYVLLVADLWWSQANYYCASQYGTTLATIKNDADASLILSNFSYINAHAWIGLNDIETEGDWVWASGYECNGNCSDLDWWNWLSPDNYAGDEDCAVAHLLSDNRSISEMIGDINCASVTGSAFICDKGLWT